MMYEPDHLWKKAAESLSEDDKLSFNFSRPDKPVILVDILAAAETKRQMCIQKRWKFKTPKGETVILRDVCEKMLKWVRKFKEIGDIAVSYDPSHAALPWAAVRIILQASINDVQTFGAMAEGLEQVSRSITGCYIIEQLYLQETSVANENLQDSLIKLYAVILEYLASAIKYYGRGTLERLGRSVLQTSENLCEDRLRKLASEHAQVQHWRQLIDGERQQRVLSSHVGTQASIDTLRYDIQSLMAGATEQSTASQKLEAILSSLQQPIHRMSDTLTHFNDNLARSERLEILRWLSTVPYRKHHIASISAVLHASGEWLYSNARFNEWQSSSCSSLLWFGQKQAFVGYLPSSLLYYDCPTSLQVILFTTIASLIHHLLRASRSIVIENLLKRKSESSAPFAYFYCARDPSEPQRADPEEVLRAIVKQLSCSDSSRSLAEPVVHEYQKRKRDAEEDGLEPSKLSTQYSTDIILALVNQGPAILVIDALDECNPTQRYQLLNSLFNIIETSSNVVKILVSSRNDADLVARLNHFPNISINANDNGKDIQRFICVEVDRAIRERRLLSGRVSMELKDRIIARLSTGADGMFRWASLQIQNLCDFQRMKIAKDVEAALERLPTTLSELYDLIFDQISRIASEGQNIAEAVLKWLLCSQRPLSTREMIEFVSPRAEGISTIELDVADVLSLCCNLVIQDIELDTFRFAHVSVREYLEMRADFHGELLHAMAVEKCLELVTTDLRTPVTYPNALPKDMPTTSQYATIFCVVHYQKIGLSTRRPKLLPAIKFLFIQESEISSSFPLWAAAAKACVFDTIDPYDPLYDVYTTVVGAVTSPLFALSAFGLFDLLQELETSPSVDWYEQGRNGATALYTAACYGYTDIVEFLIHKGLDPDTQTDYGEVALHRAAEYAHAPTAELLLQNKAHVGTSDDQGWTALDFAMRNKDYAMISLLIQSGARDEAQAKYGHRVAHLGGATKGSATALCTLLSRPTGYIGIKNEGQTGYLNTILQLFYLLRPIREALENSASEDEDDDAASIPIALRRLFTNMDVTEQTASARELTHVFGWDDQQSQEADDPMELYVTLLDRLSEMPSGQLMYEKFNSIFYKPAWPKCPAEGVVKMEVSATEPITLQESLALYEQRDWKTSYLAPVLLYEPRRLVYDINTNHFSIVHRRFSFPTTLAFNDNYDVTEPHSEAATSHYSLHGVLVHRGDRRGGKSYLFLKPHKEGQWIQFRNEHVSFATEEEAVDGNFGYDTPPEKLSMSCKAQGLLYLRTDMLEELLWRP